MRMKWLIPVAALAALGFSGAAMAATPGTGIVGTDHDFSHTSDFTPPAHNQICVVCHAPHAAFRSAAGPLWNHEVSTASYTLYTGGAVGSEFDSGPLGQPDGSSKLCLGCHDGTVAVDSYGGDTGSVFVDDINPAKLLGTDLSNDHPISFTYDSALALADGALVDPLSDGSGVDPMELEGGKVQCVTCHDPHNRDSVDGDFLRASRTNSAICLECHIK